MRDSAGRPINTLFRWERKRADGRAETRRDLNFTPDAIPPKPRRPKGKAPTKRARAAAAEAWQASYARRMASTPWSLPAGRSGRRSHAGSFGPEMGEAALALLTAIRWSLHLMEGAELPQHAGALEKRAVNSW